MITCEMIREKILELVHSPENTLLLHNVPAFGEPLIAFGSGLDSLLDFFKKDIGSFYLLPDEWLEKKYGHSFERAETGIVSWVLPQTKETREANEKEDRRPSKDWSLNRTFGEQFQRSMAKKLEDWLDEQGIPAIAPMASPSFEWKTSPKYGYASMWSERHIAFMCGLGTFGLCDGLISPLGKAVRYGSVIFGMSVTPTPRPYTDYREYCMYDRGCTACIDRCPAGAITLEGGHDKDKCYSYQLSLYPSLKEDFSFDGTYGCGLCQTCTPCEYGIPGKNER